LVEDLEAMSDQPVQVHTTDNSLAPRIIENQLADVVLTLMPSVAIGHRKLNPTRTILPGEWHELLLLQNAQGAEQLLTWQARARRATTERPYGVTPAYYQACAAQAVCDTYRPAITWSASAFGDCNGASETARVSAKLDPACDALLREMGICERHHLGAISYDLIAAWQTALTHPGMLAQFTSPVGFAVAQMRRGNASPPIAELDRWAERARRKDDRYEVWRYMDVPAIADDVIAHEQQLETRVRAIAPPNADLADLCELARCIEAGASDAEALACLHARHTGELA
jgi:hypothetical protein